MGSWFSSNKFSKEELELALNEAKKIISSNPVVVFSKTYCGFCTSVKELLTQLGASYKVIELDQKSDGDAIQSALAEWTGQTTVPNVFIGGQHIGGCDSVTEKHNRGQLVPLLADVVPLPMTLLSCELWFTVSLYSSEANVCWWI